MQRQKARECDEAPPPTLRTSPRTLCGLGIGKGLDQPPAADHDHETDEKLAHALALSLHLLQQQRRRTAALGRMAGERLEPPAA